MKERQRFEAGYIVDPDSGCWFWARSIDSGGAGRMRYEGRLRQAHQVALLLAGVELDPNREIAAAVRSEALRQSLAFGAGAPGLQSDAWEALPESDASGVTDVYLCVW